MIAYLYAITDRLNEPLPGQVGLGDAQLAEVAWRDIVAIVSAHDAAPSLERADDLWRHEDVIESLMDRRAVLPVRFGTVLPSHLDVVDMLCRRYTAFSEDLGRLRGCIEIGVRVLSRAGQDAPVAPPAPAVEGPGTAFLRAKLAGRRGRERLHAGLLERARDARQSLDRFAQASRLDRGSMDADSISIAFLVPRANVEAFRLAVGEFAESQAAITLLCTGPWPPYSFVGGAADGATTGGDRHDSLH